MISMFEVAMKPRLQAVGVTPQPTWNATKHHIFNQAKAQLQRPNLKPATAEKWEALARIARPADKN